jgi:hypothetical protein
MTPAVQKEDRRLSHPVAITGITTGVLLVVVMLSALIVTNRIPLLEADALERNAISYGLFFAVMLIPICRFLNQPLRLFGAAMIGWTMFAAGYDLAGFAFKNLFEVLRRTPLEALLEGTIVYGICAVAVWVVSMISHARRHPVATAGHRAARQSVTNHR